MAEDETTKPDLFGLVDRVSEQPTKTWWGGLDADRKAAWQLLIAAGAFGVLGTPLLSLLLASGDAPSSKNLAASAWLLVVTAPVAAVVAVVAYVLTTPPLISGGPQLLIVCVLAAVVGIGVMDGLIEAAGGSLADFYCYNDGAVRETACRAFQEQGLARTPPGSPSQNAAFLGNVLVLTSAARGLVMTVCGGLAGGAAGYLARKS